MTAASLAIFGPQSRAPKPAYLASVRSFVTNHTLLCTIQQSIGTLYDVLSLLAVDNPLISQSMPQARRYTDLLVSWFKSDPSDTNDMALLREVASQSSGIVALPRLAIVQLAQYFDYLEAEGLEHNSFVEHVNATGGGIQGLCGGLPAAFAVSLYDSAPEKPEEQDRAKKVIMTVIRLAYAIGLYAELGDDSTLPGTTSLCLRLKTEGQAQEIVTRFPHVGQVPALISLARHFFLLPPLCLRNQWVSSGGFEKHFSNFTLFENRYISELL